MGETGTGIRLDPKDPSKTRQNTALPIEAHSVAPSVCRIIPACKFSAVACVVVAKKKSTTPHCPRRFLSLICFPTTNSKNQLLRILADNNKVKNTYELTLHRSKRTHATHTTQQLPHEGPSIPYLHCVIPSCRLSPFVLYDTQSLSRINLQPIVFIFHCQVGQRRSPYSFQISAVGQEWTIAPRFSRLRLSAPEKRRQRQRPATQSTVPPTVPPTVLQCPLPAPLRH